MTRGGYRLLVVLLFALAAIGAWLLLPRPGELSPTVVSCEAFHEHPVTGHVRLTGCVVDARFPTYHHVGERGDDALVYVWPSDYVESDEPPEVPALVLFTRDPEVLSVVDRIHGFDDDDRTRRFGERHETTLLRARDLEGEIGPAGLSAAELVATDGTLDASIPVLDETGGSVLTWPVGLALLLFGLLGLLVITRKQRQWTRARERVTGVVRPVTF
ncbi:MAG: hypothetical protein KC619_23100 [Myxococcales bacterium]|nr:hypothetical protein [Myxococcales bacterium]